MDSVKDSIAVIDYIREQGFENPEKINKWVTEIIKNRESFDEKYLVQTESMGRQDARPEKFLVKKEARTLIDNLCILYPFNNLFGSRTNGGPKVCIAYRFLMDKDQENKAKLNQKGLELQKSLDEEKRLNDKALQILPIFIEVLTKNMPIDITELRLRDFMQAESCHGKIIDLSDAFKLGAWNELTRLKNSIGESSETYQQIGEVLIELGHITAASEALDQATDLDPTNGVAWAIKAFILKKMVEKNTIDYMKAGSQTDFEPVHNPIDPEEHWNNERIVDIFSTIDELHNDFIESCFFALQHWPLWNDEHHTNWKGEKKKNYQPNINMTRSCRMDISRHWLFFHFVIALNKTDLIGERSNNFASILKTFLSYDQSPFPYLIFSPFSLEANNETTFKLKLVEILNWFDKTEAQRAIESLIDDFRKRPFNAAESLSILGFSRISGFIWDYLGKDEYTNLYSLCEGFELRNSKIRKLTIISRMQLDSILNALNPFIETIHKKHNEENLPKRFHDSMESAKKKIVSWDAFLNDELWVESPFSPDLPTDLFSLLFVSSFIELVTFEDSIIGTKTLTEFLSHKDTLKTAIKNLQAECDIHPLVEHIIDELLKKNPFDQMVNRAAKIIDEIFGEIYNERPL